MGHRERSKVISSGWRTDYVSSILSSGLYMGVSSKIWRETEAQQMYKSMEPHWDYKHLAQLEKISGYDRWCETIQACNFVLFNVANHFKTSVIRELDQSRDELHGSDHLKKRKKHLKGAKTVILLVNRTITWYWSDRGVSIWVLRWTGRQYIFFRNSLWQKSIRQFIKLRST